MIKAVGQRRGEPLVVLGLTRENVTRLLADEPILFNLEELGLAPTEVLIIGGETEAAIARQLASATDSKTKLRLR